MAHLQIWSYFAYGNKKRRIPYLYFKFVEKKLFPKIFNQKKDNRSEKTPIFLHFNGQYLATLMINFLRFASA
jgi:hypothetical protein